VPRYPEGRMRAILGLRASLPNPRRDPRVRVLPFLDIDPDFRPSREMSKFHRPSEAFPTYLS